MSERLKIFLACAIGAGIGTLASLHLAGLFVVLGFLTGAVCGYLLYEPMTVIRAIPAAWRLAVASVRWSVRNRLELGAFVTFYVLGHILCFAFFYAADTRNYEEKISSVLIASAICGLVASIFNTLLLHSGESGVNKEYLKYFGNPARLYFVDVPRGLWFAISHSFVWVVVALKYTILLAMAIPFILGYGGMVLLGWYLPRLIRDVGLVVGRFLYHVFVMIHSERRFLCLVDAGLGSLVGFYAGSVLIGMIAGAAFGLLNYEIVSLRILGLQPVKK